MSYRKLIYYSFLLIALADGLMYIENAGFNAAFLPIVALVSKYLALIFLIHFSIKSDWQQDFPSAVLVIFKLLLAWNIFTIAHGAFLANDYWDWKFLFYSSGLFLLVPLVLFIGRNLYYTRLLFEFILRYWFQFGFFAIPLAFATNIELYARLMIPTGIFILFIPYLHPRWKILVLVVSVTSILVYVGFRTNILKIAASLLIVSTYYYRYLVPLWVLKVVHAVLFVLPLFLLSLGMSGTYNIFSEMANSEGFEMETQSQSSENLAADTRTLLYVEVFSVLQNNGKMLIGEGASGKYKSDLFDYLGDERGRYGSEVGFLNTLLYSGIIGISLYALFLIIISYYAIYKSNNWLCKMMGILVAFRWFLYFIEEFTNFDVNFFFFWLILGMLSSKKFRSLNNREIRQFFSFSVQKKAYIKTSVTTL